MNNVTLIGRLANDPEMGYAGQTPICKFTLAVDRMKEGADFIRITVFGKQAENCKQYLSKGRQTAVMGHIQTGSYKKGEQTIYTTDVIADRVEFLSKAEKAEKSVEKERYNAFSQVDEYPPF